MAFPLKQLVPCLCTILLLSIISFSHAKAKPCNCPDSDQDRRSNQTIDDTTAAFYLIEDAYNPPVLVGLDVLNNHPEFLENHLVSIIGLSRPVALWQDRPGGLGVDEASFSVTIVYRPYPHPRGIIAFLVIPSEMPPGTLAREYEPTNINIFPMQSNGSLNLQGTTSRNATVHGSSVSITIGELTANNWQRALYTLVIEIDINIDAGSALSYSVWIDYDHVGSRMSVYVDSEGSTKPDNTIAEVNLNISSAASDVASGLFVFGLLSTVRQEPSVRWNVTVEDLPYYPDKGGFLSGKVTILSSVLGSVAVTATMATTLACYFNSRYRRWKKDLDQLASSMERLPGMPTKLEFADIKKATGNFHETMKLGGGGFGTVYRCTLPATASKRERPIDVAVKRFTSDLQNRRYEDFLAEVSIINRLRHKNIAPLVGWSYNKGEPLLVFDYMTNGSLDQHLFSKGSSSRTTSQRRNGATILPWVTRYEIVRDIVTGLHYVHHEYEPMVLHRDIKASNVMLDSGFRARLGDFGIACTVAVDRNSATGLAGTWGYIAPEYAMCGKATWQTDIYALGVLILEIVTGQRALAGPQVMNDDEIHISDRVWNFHREGSLTECVDAALIIPSSPEEDEQLYAGGEAERLLLLGLACSNPNPSDRPTMPEVVRVIAKSAPPPKVPPYKPRFMWPPPEEGRLVGSDLESTGTSMMSYLDRSTMGIGELEEQVGMGQPAVPTVGSRRHASFQLDQSV